MKRRDFLKKGTSLASLAVASSLSFSKKASAGAHAKQINVLTVGDPWDMALQNSLKIFEEKTGIKVNLESLGYPALQARLVNSFLTKTSDADVIAVDQMWISQYADNGWIRSLDDFISQDSDTDLNDFLPEVLYSLSTWRGNIWTLPVAAYGQGIMYRTDVFDELGLNRLPKSTKEASNWTWEEYFKLVAKVNGTKFKGKDFYGTTLIGQQPVPVVHMYTQLAASYGVKWFEKFPRAPWNFNTTINSKQNVSALKDWIKLYEMSPPEAINYLWFDAGTRFSGPADIGMFFHWTPYFYLINNDGYLTGKPSSIVGNVETAVLPTRDAGGEQTVSLGGWSLGMPSTSSNQDEAWQFIKFATSSEGQKAMGKVNKAGYQFADFSRKSLYEDKELNKLYPFLDTQLEMMLLGNGKIVRPPAPIYTSLEGVYGLHLNKAMAKTMSPEDALQSTEALFNTILSGNQYVPEYNLESFDDTLESTKNLINRLT